MYPARPQIEILEITKGKDHLVEDATEVEEEADDTVVVGPEASAEAMARSQ